MEFEIKNIGVTVAGKSLLDQISFFVEKNKFVGIIGPNGSGKSTLLKCIYRVVQPDKGTIFFDGKKLESLKLKESAQNVAVMEQHTNYVDFDFSVEEIVIMGRSPYKKTFEMDTPEDYAIVNEALSMVGLCGMEKRKISTLSGGERQRVALARVLAQKTPCLVMDEPTNHLDIKYQLQIMKIIKRIECTVIAAVHDLNLAAAFCDEIIALKDGKIVGYGKPEVLFSPTFISELYGVVAEVQYSKWTNKINVVYVDEI